MDILGLLMIFFARVIDVSCSTIRIIFLVKGKRSIAACIGFFEVMLYMLILERIFGGGRSLTFVELIFYCGGFATGNYVGSYLESRFMNSYILAEVIVDDSPDGQKVIEDIRGHGYGATVIHADGKNGARLLAEIFCRRNDVSKIMSIVSGRGFVATSDVRTSIGGWFPNKRK